MAGSAIQWLRDGMQLFKKASDSEAAALASQNENEVYAVPAFTGLGAPYWDSDAGCRIRDYRGTTKEDFIKATLQSLAYQSRDVLDTMKRDSGIDIPAMRVDGGASNNNYLMQFQADILGIEIHRAHDLETTHWAAFLAGLAVGYWQDLDELKAEYQPGKSSNHKWAKKNAATFIKVGKKPWLQPEILSTNRVKQTNS